MQEIKFYFLTANPEKVSIDLRKIKSRPLPKVFLTNQHRPRPHYLSLTQIIAEN